MATAADVIAAARAELGNRESPRGSNNSKYNAAYGAPRQPWCGMFVWYVFRKVGIDLRKYSDNPAYTPNFAGDLAAKGWTVTKKSAQPGDIVFFDFPGHARRIEHVGIVVQNQGPILVTIEGNTSLGNNSNGGQVLMRTRALSLVKAVMRPPMLGQHAVVQPKPAQTPPAPSPAASVGLQAFARGVAEAKTHTLQIGSKGDPVKYLQIGLNLKYGGSGKTGLLEDGDFGPRTRDFVMWTQGVSGLAIDGIVGPATWHSIYP